MKNSDGKLYKVDDPGYSAIRLYMTGKSPEEITNELDVDEREADNFFKKLELLGISS